METRVTVPFGFLMLFAHLTVSLFTTSPISYLVHRSVSLLSSLVHDG